MLKEIYFCKYYYVLKYYGPTTRADHIISSAITDVHSHLIIIVRTIVSGRACCFIMSSHIVCDKSRQDMTTLEISG